MTEPTVTLRFFAVFFYLTRKGEFFAMNAFVYGFTFPSKMGNTVWHILAVIYVQLEKALCFYLSKCGR
jgi:hypothetical protein